MKSYAACNQARIEKNPPDAGDNAVQWIKKMPKVHLLMGIRGTAPIDANARKAAKRFIAYMKTKSVLDSWLLSFYDLGTNTIYCMAARVVANPDNVADTVDTITATKATNTYEYWKIVEVQQPDGSKKPVPTKSFSFTLPN